MSALALAIGSAVATALLMWRHPHLFDRHKGKGK